MGAAEVISKVHIYAVETLVSTQLLCTHIHMRIQDPYTSVRPSQEALRCITEIQAQHTPALQG